MIYYIGLRQMSSNIKTAGGIVIHKDKILFIYKNDKWDLPKGRLEEGNNSRQTAIIEISEETGLPQENLKILRKLIPTYYYKNTNGRKILKKTYWYLVEFTGDRKIKLVPDFNENITDCKWVSPDELVLVLAESHERIRYLIEFFLSMPFYNDYKAKFIKS